MKGFVKVLLYIWQLPQNLLGLLMSCLYRGTTSYFEVDEYVDFEVHYSSRMGGGISLGKYIILNRKADSIDIMHEFGHCWQSMYLGWLYLIVIGLPSLVWATLHTYCESISEKYDYYSFYTEKWADKIGGVKR